MLMEVPIGPASRSAGPTEICAAANEAQAAVIEIVGVEIVEAYASARSGPCRC